MGRTIYREDNSPGDCSPEDYSLGVETFDQFSQIYFNNADKARVKKLGTVGFPETSNFLA